MTLFVNDNFIELKPNQDTIQTHPNWYNRQKKKEFVIDSFILRNDWQNDVSEALINKYFRFDSITRMLMIFFILILDFNLPICFKVN